MCKHSKLTNGHRKRGTESSREPPIWLRCWTIQQEPLTHSLPHLPPQLFMWMSVSKAEWTCKASHSADTVTLTLPRSASRHFASCPLDEYPQSLSLRSLITLALARDSLLHFPNKQLRFSCSSLTGYFKFLIRCKTSVWTWCRTAEKTFNLYSWTFQQCPKPYACSLSLNFHASCHTLSHYINIQSKETLKLLCMCSPPWQ